MQLQVRGCRTQAQASTIVHIAICSYAKFWRVNVSPLMQGFSVASGLSYVYQKPGVCVSGEWAGGWEC